MRRYEISSVFQQ